jgi:hypothetical protein
MPALSSDGARIPMDLSELNTARGEAMLETFADLDQRLRAEGFEPRSPSGEVAAQDEGICVMLACRACRRAGLVYRPYLTARFGRRSRERYRPVAACDDCGQALEF